jgi:hypothetical protein
VLVIYTRRLDNGEDAADTTCMHIKYYNHYSIQIDMHARFTVAGTKRKKKKVEQQNSTSLHTPSPSARYIAL